ncbi:hypothetical protein VNI00_011918 [Paramarasmius palmivorus]|uniref:Uncharacterized protein n=1 Tax=Paramarasmius palmivorus TaxID=297713 RepID=A0AAW0C973_9AGAR
MSRNAGTNLKAKARAVVARITRNRLTFVFFLFGFTHCFAQGIIQSFLFTIDSEYSAFFTSITKAANIPNVNHTDLIVSGRDYRLDMCNYIPHNDNTCSHIFDSTTDVVEVVGPDQNAKLRGALVKEMRARQNLTLQAFPEAQNPNDNSVILNATYGAVAFSKKCTSILLYPQQHMENSRREDLAFVLLQFWLFGISIMAMIYDSVPHVLAGLGARVLITAWSSYALWRSYWQQKVYYAMIESPNSPYEIIDLVLNCTALTISCYLSFTLLKLYNTQSFNYMGAPKKIVRIQRLEVFVLLVASGLWVDQLFNTYIRYITDWFELFVAIFIFVTIALVPWMITGWYGIRHEHRVATGVFIVLGFLFFSGSCIMFYSQVYRWTYYAWPNMGCFTTASILLFLASFVLGLLCRLNFGKGLSQYLHAEAALASSNFAPEVFEHDVEKDKTYMEELTQRRPQEQPLPTYYAVALPTLSR